MSDGSLAKIVELQKPLSRLDIQVIKDELANKRPDETRDVAVFCRGTDVSVLEDLALDKSPINNIVIFDILKDGMIVLQPAEADILMQRKGNEVNVEILDYISPAILSRLEVESGVFRESISDFRVQIDYVLIDNNYDGSSFNAVYCDVPRKKADLIVGSYNVNVPNDEAVVAILIVDMLGEEVLIEK